MSRQKDAVLVEAWLDAGRQLHRLQLTGMTLVIQKQSLILLRSYCFSRA